MAYLWDLVGELPDGSKAVAARFTSYERANEYLYRATLKCSYVKEDKRDYPFSVSSLLGDCIGAEIVKTMPEGPPIDPVPHYNERSPWKE